MPTVVRAPVLQTPTSTSLEVMLDAVIAVDDRGTITAVEPAASVAGSALLRTVTSDATVDDGTSDRGATGGGPNRPRFVRVPEGRWLLPGLVDLHVHAPQWPQLGTGLDLPLERWLFEYTFPLEARYADIEFAVRVWDHLVPSLLAHGTTTAVYYGTVHAAATLALAAACLRSGQRAFVGRVAMDHPVGTPEWYRDPSAAAGISASAESVRAIRELAGPDELVRPIITPRFAPACTDALLEGLGELATSTGALVQTHCSESDWQHGHAQERFGTTDLEALARFGLAREHSVLAHATLLGDAEFPSAARLGVGIAHCPLSNAFFGNAVFPVRRALDSGVRVGLGSDVAGGAHPGLLHNASAAVTVSRLLDDGVDQRLGAGERGVPGSSIDAVAAFWLATLGGADVLGLPIGLLAPGRQFDAFAVDTTAEMSALRSWSEVDDPARIFEKIVHLAGPSEITDVWVAGRQVR